MLTEKYFDTGEVTINYAEGPAAGPPLLLLHGLRFSPEIQLLKRCIDQGDLGRIY